MKNIFCSFAFLCSVLSLHAQDNDGKIKGSVTDVSQKAIEAATVELFRASNKALVKSAITDKLGNFELEKIAGGKYFVGVTAVGYEKKVSAEFEIMAAKPVVTIEKLQLLRATKSLGEVTITGTRPPIEQKPDRTIVNVDASPSNAGATALEVLEKSPGVTVDNDGRISLKGKSGVIVMMDGKPTYLSGTDLANVLRNLPASALDQIEIMTNPSSKYDAAGNSGIINIKTKKNQNAGANGSITAGNTTSLFRTNGKEELLWRPTLSVNFNYKKKKLNFFGNAVYNYREGRGRLNLDRRLYSGSQPLDSFNLVNTLFNFRNNNYTLKLGMDYFANKKNVFGIVLNGFLFAGRPRPTTYTTFTNQDGDIFSRINSITDNKLSWKNSSVNLNYKHSFDTTARELTADFDLSYYKNVSDQLLNTGFFDRNFHQTADSMYLKGHLPSDIKIYSLKTDYVHPFKNGTRVEAGLKSSYVKSDNLVDYIRKFQDTWYPDSRNNHFIYDENINAAYINASRQVKKWNMQTGLRVENTNSKGFQKSTNSTVERHYTNLFPSAFLSYTINTKNQVTASFSRRVQRPNYQDLNPFTFFLDSLSFRQGNPYLTPQFSYNYELIHTWGGKITTTLNYTSTSDVISNILKQQRGSKDEILTFLTIDNVAKFNNMGIAVSAPLKPAKWWSTVLYGNVYHNQYKGSFIATETNVPKLVELDLSYTSFTFNITNTFTIAKGLSAELSGWYRYKTLEDLSISEPMGQFSIALAKNNLLKGKGSLRLNARDPFNLLTYRASVRYGSIDQQVRFKGDVRQYGISFTYRFGKATENGPPKKRPGSSQDEQNRVGAGQQ